jgi:hypothetical protein
MGAGKVLLMAVLAVEGVLLLRPDGALVQAARHAEPRAADLAVYWWRESPVHMGCSVASCTRPATRTATYRLTGPRATTWRAYGFCNHHAPPETLEGLVYRQGRPPRPGYDIPLGPVWSEVYFLLGIFAFGIWCACMWTYVRVKTRAAVWAGLLALHAGVLVALWMY